MRGADRLLGGEAESTVRAISARRMVCARTLVRRTVRPSRAVPTHLESPWHLDSVWLDEPQKPASGHRPIDNASRCFASRSRLRFVFQRTNVHLCRPHTFVRRPAFPRYHLEFVHTTHLFTVWNPTYEADALQLHLEVLLATMREAREGTREHDDVFVWWGKVRSVNRQAPLPHLGDVLAVDAQIETDDTDAPEVQIYLTDYRSLYVAHVGAVKNGSDFTPDAQVPAYYAAHGLKCDCWFMLWDIRQLVSDDTTAVAATLAMLRNTRYNDRPVSIYGGVVDLPLLVTCADETRWFDDATRERYTGGRFWAEYDAEQRGVGEMQRELRLNRFGTAAWTALDPGVRRFIASAEATFRAHRDDMAFELSPVIVSLANAMEVQVNLLLRAAMRGASPDVRFTNIEGQTVDLSHAGALSLGALARAIPETKARCDWLRSKLEQGEWFVSSLPPMLAELAEQRNDAAHGKGVAREDVVRVRERLNGVGSVGVLVQLAGVRVR